MYLKSKDELKMSKKTKTHEQEVQKCDFCKSDAKYIFHLKDRQRDALCCNDCSGLYYVSNLDNISQATTPDGAEVLSDMASRRMKILTEQHKHS